MRPHAGTLWRKPREHPPLSRKTTQPEPESRPTIEQPRPIENSQSQSIEPKTISHTKSDKAKNRTTNNSTADRKPIKAATQSQSNQAKYKTNHNRKPSNSTTNPTQPIENKAPNQTDPIQKSKQSNRLFNPINQPIQQTPIQSTLTSKSRMGRIRVLRGFRGLETMIFGRIPLL